MLSNCLIMIFFCILSEISSIPIAVEPNDNVKTSVVRVNVFRRIKKRSLYNSNYGYDMELNVFDLTHTLKLRSPSNSLFTDGFEYHDVDLDSNGNLVHIERTPSKREIQDIEENIYVDSDKNAVLKVRDVDGDYHLEGLLGTMRISRDTNGSDNVAEDTKSDNADTNNKHDYLDLHRPIAMGRAMSTGKTVVSPEVALVFDFDNSKHFNHDSAKILDYLAVMLNSVNNRYGTMDDPKITFKISGVYSIKTLAAQPFLEKNKSGNNIIIEKVLNSFKEWVFENLKTLPKHDLVPLLYSYNPLQDVVGLAFLNGACWVQPQSKSAMATSVVHDTGGSWAGALTLAHELAHNLGSPHDGEEKNKACPWNLGYIMSYEGHGKPNKFQFSRCSQTVMKAFIESTGGTCLKIQDNKSPPKSILGSIGDRITMQELCKERTGIANATVFKDNPNEQCMELVCKYNVVTRMGNQQLTQTKFFSYGELPGENSPCGAKGKCKQGKCIG